MFNVCAVAHLVVLFLSPSLKLMSQLPSLGCSTLKGFVALRIGNIFRRISQLGYCCLDGLACLSIELEHVIQLSLTQLTHLEHFHRVQVQMFHVLLLIRLVHQIVLRHV